MSITSKRLIRRTCRDIIQDPTSSKLERIQASRLIAEMSGWIGEQRTTRRKKQLEKESKIKPSAETRLSSILGQTKSVTSTDLHSDGHKVSQCQAE